MQILCGAEIEHRVLDGEDQEEPGEGPWGAAPAGWNGMAYHRDMGMRTEAGGKGEDAGVARLYAEPYLSERYSGEEVCAAGRWAGNGGGAGGGKAREIGTDYTDF